MGDTGEQREYFRPFTPFPIGGAQPQPQLQDAPSISAKPREDLKEYGKLSNEISNNFDPARFANIPLQELDSAYNGTFMIVTRSQRIYRFCQSNALWLFSPLSPVRRKAIALLTHPAFSWTILLTVIANLYFLATSNYSERDLFELPFIFIYTLEFIVKITARGFLLDSFTFMRDAWNVLDLAILILAYAGLITGMNDGLAALRVLKIIPNVFDLRLAFQYFTDVLKHLLDVTILTSFSLAIFALIGLSMYMGIMTQICIKAYPGISITNVDFDKWNSNRSNWLPYPDAADVYPSCGNFSGSNSCPEGYVCLGRHAPNPDYGYTSFDNFFFSFLSSVRMFKLDFWEALYQQLSKIRGGFCIIYFALIMFTCSFYLLALIFGVAAKTISESLERKQDLRTTDTQRTSWLGRVKNGIENIWGMCPDMNCICCSHTLKEYLKLVVFNPITAIFIKVIIILHTLCMFQLSQTLKMREHDQLQQFLKIAVLIFQLIYCLEFLLKIGALGPNKYFAKGWRRFEFAIVLAVLLENLIYAAFGSTGFLWFLRILVVLRLAQHWPEYERLLKLIKSAFTKELGAFFTIIQIFLLSFALIGSEWFGDNYYRHKHDDRPRWNFIYFANSYMLIFRALCGEWIESMWDCLYVGGADCLTFFGVVVIVGNFLTLTFFLLLYKHVTTRALSGDDDDNDDDEESPNPFSTVVEKVTSKLGICIRTNSARLGDDEEVLDAEIKLPPPHIQSGALGQFLENFWLRLFIVLFIIASSIALCFDDVYAGKTPTGVFVVDIIFILVISIEVIMKLAVLRYWKSGWCIVDIVIVLMSVIELFQGLSGVRPFRGFRLLMIISRIPSLKEIAGTILIVFRKILGIVSACACFWLVFALLGVAMLHGKFHKCIDPSVEGDRAHYLLIGSKQECLTNNMTWDNSDMNFDHISNAYLCLFMVSSFKGWIGIMYDAVDSRDIDLQPRKEYAYEMYLYFILFIVFGVFLPLGVILGEAVIHLNRQGKSKITYLFMDRSELYYTAAKKLRKGGGTNNKRREAVRPQGTSALYTCFTGKTFGTVNATLMGIYLVVAATEHDGMNEHFYQFYFVVDCWFMIFITMEAILKIIVFRRQYFTEPANIFDLFVVVLSILDLFFTEVGLLGTISPKVFCIIRAGRVVLSSLIDHRPGMRTLMLTVSSSFSEIVKCSLLLLTVICSYSLFGMLQFKNVKLRGALDNVHNFQSFSHSFSIMFEVTTGAGWDGVLDGIADESECVVGRDCGSATVAIPFLISYLVICFNVVAYMFLTVIQKYFSEVTKAKLDLKEEDVKNFDEVWEQFDPENSGYIEVNRLANFLNSLKPPLQVKMENNEGTNNSNGINALGVIVYPDDLVSGEDVFAALVKKHFQTLTTQIYQHPIQ